LAAGRIAAVLGVGIAVFPAGVAAADHAFAVDAFRLAVGGAADVAAASAIRRIVAQARLALLITVTVAEPGIAIRVTTLAADAVGHAFGVGARLAAGATVVDVVERRLAARGRIPVTITEVTVALDDALG